MTRARSSLSVRLGIFLGRTLILGPLVFASGAACDEAPLPPPPTVETPTTAPAATDESQPSEPDRPTTQALLTGPRKQVTLASLPLTAKVPESWTVEPIGAGTVTLLHGPTPSGTAQIQLSHRPFVKREQFDALLAGARKEMSQNPQTVQAVDTWQVTGGARAMERRSVGRPMPALPTDPLSTQPAAPRTGYSWTITYFVPAGEGFDTYELNFVGLTREQYEADQRLLRGIIGSVEHTGLPSPASTAPAASAS